MSKQHLRTVRLVKDADSSSYSEWNAHKNWSSQEWKSDEVMELERGDPWVDKESSQETDKFVIDDYAMDSDTATESNHSLKSRSFLNRVNDRLRKKLDLSSKDAMQYICLLHWKHMYSCGKNHSENVHSIKKMQGEISQ